jgi:isopenicillin-N N-acyltransferase-like protein
MRRRDFLKNSALGSAALALNPWLPHGPDRAIKPQVSDTSRSAIKKQAAYLVLEGPPRSRGRIHGEALRSQINALMEIWKDQLGRQYKVDPKQYIQKFLADTKFPEAIRKWTPGLMEEVRGIAEGAAVDAETMLAYQFVDEEWWYGGHGYFQTGEPVPMDKNCSALAVSGQPGLPTFVAQNLDIPAYTDGYQALLHIKHQNSSLQSLVFVYAGMISLCGMNNRGVGEVVNALLQLNHRGDGLPVAFINRGILECESLEEAVKFIRQIKHASGQNYIVGGPQQVVNFEGSANKVSRYEPLGAAARIYHTNHPLVNDDQSIIQELIKGLPQGRGPRHPDNSEIRLMALEKRLKDPAKRITVDVIKEALSSKDDPRNPVCLARRPDGRGSFTAGCLIMELSEKPKLHFAPGPPCATEFQTHTFVDAL